MAKKKGKKGKKAAKKQKKAKKAAAKAARKAKKAAKKQRKASRRAGTASAPKTAARKVARKAVRRKPARARAAAPRKKARQKPESLRLRSAGPSFTVSDLEKSIAFYRDALGFTPKDRWEQDGVLLGIELVAGSVSLWLGQDDWKKGHDRVKGQGFRVYCTTTQDIDALAARVRAAGFTLLEEPQDRSWGGRDFAVRDPDGFTLSIAKET